MNDVFRRLHSIIETIRKLKPTFGMVVSIAVITIPVVAWFISYDFSGMSTTEVIGTTLMRGAAFLGMAMYAWSLILSGRYKLLDSWFKGLDQTYIAHRFFGSTVMAILFLHPLGYTVLFMAENGTEGLMRHFFGYASVGVTLGRISLYGLILVALWSIIAKVKHETFIKIHRWLGLMFILGAIHAFMAGPDSSLAQSAFLWWYMFVLSLTASLTFLHYSLLGDFLHPYYKYKVKAVRQLPGDVVDIELTPKYRLANFSPGQFFYVAFDALGADAYHPYSVASSNTTTTMRFIVKALGDYTNQLKDVPVGTTARLKGPYGGFTFNDRKHPKQLWIAGGIGITPFLSKAHSLKYSKLSPRIEMFHFAKTEAEAIERAELDIIEQGHKAFDYTCLPEAKFGIISLKDIVAQLGPLDEYAIYMCGPPPMLRAYDAQAKELGIHNQLHYEEFSY